MSRESVGWGRLAAVAAASLVSSVAVDATTTLMVDLQGGSPLSQRIAVQSCSGLLNRADNVKTSGTMVYSLLGGDDLKWWNATNQPPTSTTPPATVLLHCVQSPAVSGRWIRYNATTQKLVVPLVITLAGVLDAVPLESPAAAALGLSETSMVFDAQTKWASLDVLSATAFVFDTYANQTTAMAKMNPGLDVHQHPIFPNITGEPNPGLIDFVVKERLFNFFLNDGCIPFSPQHALMERIASTNPWPRPAAVYGYDDTFGVIGDPFEAETTCAMHDGKSVGMGQVASDGCSNLAYWSQSPITAPVEQNPRLPKRQYNPERTYIALVVGDGDNINFDKGSRFDWMRERVTKCAAGGDRSKSCFPLLWTISPHLLHVAPEWLRWYLAQCRVTGQDWLVLPPSGDLYSYPSLMTSADQARFVANTERDCELLSTSATVAWEWFGTWRNAIDNYFPRYGTKGVVRSLFATNVPYPVPILEFAPGEFYKTFNKSSVLFRPREWRGTANASDPFRNAVCSPAQLAHEISSTYPKGSVGHIYLTSDGGASLDSFYELVALLADHVDVVDHETIADMALQRTAMREARGEDFF